MPKVVDHESYRNEIAAKAAQAFSRHGYSNLGMRKIAEEIGISKSALYHYFPSKEELFSAASRSILDFSEVYKQIEHLENESIDIRLKAYFHFILKFEKIFPAELSLLVDYLHGKTTSDVIADENMNLANREFLRISKLFVGEENAKGMLCLMLGLLLQRYFDGHSTDMEEIESWVFGLLG